MSELLCSNCQTAIRHDARFCGVCGAKLNPITQSPSQAQQTQSNQRYPNLLSEYEEFVPRGIQKKAQTSVPIDQLESLYKDIKKGREPQFSAAIQFFNDYLPIGSGVRLLNLIRDVNDEVNKGKIYNILIQMNDFELIQKIVSNKDYLSSFDLYHKCLILEGKSDPETIKWLGSNINNSYGFIPLIMLARLSHPLVIETIIENTYFGYMLEKYDNSSDRSFLDIMLSPKKSKSAERRDTFFKFANAIADSIAINNAIADGGTLASLPYVPYEVAEEAMTGLEPSVLKSRYKLDLVLQKLNLFPQTPLNKFWPEKAPKVEIKRYAFLTAIYLARGESNSLTQEYLDFLLNNKNAMEANNDSTFLIAYALTRYQRMINNPVWNDFLRILTQHKFGFLNRGTRDLIVVYNYTPMLQQVISERKYDTSALVYSAIYNNNVTNSQILQSATDPKDRAVFEEWKKRFIDWGYK